MKKLTKISAAALVALFLAACDKPADKAQATEAPKNTEVAQQTPVIEKLTDAAKADFQKILAWNVEQQQSVEAAQAALQQKLATQDMQQMQEGLATFNSKIEEVIKSLEAVEVSDAQVKSFKEQTKGILVLSSEVLSEQVKTMANPTDQTLVQALQQKTQTLIEASNNLQKLNDALQQKLAEK